MSPRTERKSSILGHGLTSLELSLSKEGLNLAWLQLYQESTFLVSNTTLRRSPFAEVESWQGPPVEPPKCYCYFLPEMKKIQQIPSTGKVNCYCSSRGHSTSPPKEGSSNLKHLMYCAKVDWILLLWLGHYCYRWRFHPRTKLENSCDLHSIQRQHPLKMHLTDCWLRALRNRCWC